jgi:hypothetical protein
MIKQKKQIERLAEVNAETIAPRSVVDETETKIEQNGKSLFEATNSQAANGEKSQTEKNGNSKEDPFTNHKPISEVLRDIYDRK